MTGPCRIACLLCRGEVVMNAVGVLMSLVFIAIGLGMLYYARSLSAKAQQSLTWPSTEGVISHSAVLLQMRQTSDSNNAATYKADVAYRYKVPRSRLLFESAHVRRHLVHRRTRAGYRRPVCPTARRSPSATTRRPFGCGSGEGQHHWDRGSYTSSAACSLPAACCSFSGA